MNTFITIIAGFIIGLIIVGVAAGIIDCIDMTKCRYLESYDVLIKNIMSQDIENLSIPYAKVYSFSQWTITVKDKINNVKYILANDYLYIGNDKIENCRPSRKMSHKFRKFIRKQEKVLNDYQITEANNLINKLSKQDKNSEIGE